MEISDDDQLIINNYFVSEPEIRAVTPRYEGFVEYPVLLGDNEYFILAAENDSNFSDWYNMIYGHYMDNGAMFGNIEKYLDPEFFSSIGYRHRKKRSQALGIPLRIMFTGGDVSDIASLQF